MPGGKDRNDVSNLALNLVEAVKDLQQQNAQLALKLVQTEELIGYYENVLRVLAQSLDEALQMISKPKGYREESDKPARPPEIDAVLLGRFGESTDGPVGRDGRPHPTVSSRTMGEAASSSKLGQGLLERIAATQSELGALRQQVEELLSHGGADPRMRDLVIRDELTGLYNYRYFQDRLRFEVDEAKSRGYPLSVLMIDVDFLKIYNDTFGHPKGNEVLRAIAKLIRKQTRYADTAARYGGDEFAIILAATPGEGALLVGERLRKEVEMYPFEGKESLPNGVVSVSIGVAEFPSEASSDRELVQRADEECLKGKRAGKNRVMYRTPSD